MIIKLYYIDIVARNLETTVIDDPKETHTVVLFKQDEGKNIFVIDPSNQQFSSHIANIVYLDLKFIVSYNDKVKIYKPNGDTGHELDKWRDCIDIAVKLAFGFNNIRPEDETNKLNANSFNDSVKSHDVVKAITNVQSTNKDYLPDTIEDYPMRVKQSSNFELSKKIAKFLSLMNIKLLSADKYNDKLYVEQSKVQSLKKDILVQILNSIEKNYCSTDYDSAIDDFEESYCSVQKLLTEYENSLLGN